MCSSPRRARHRCTSAQAAQGTLPVGRCKPLALPSLRRTRRGTRRATAHGRAQRSRPGFLSRSASKRGGHQQRPEVATNNMMRQLSNPTPTSTTSIPPPFTNGGTMLVSVVINEVDLGPVACAFWLTNMWRKPMSWSNLLQEWEWLAQVKGNSKIN